ncbi:MAG TPA: tetratricopeptide repeat protein [Chitinophagaceae bacterium]|nr:tetratricopeptide repeat protein [Chitinophagaceae bacterium]
MRVLLFLLINYLSFQAAAQTENGDPPIVTAVKAGDIITVEKLIRKGTAINATDNNGATALLWAAGLGDLQMVKLLVSNGATVNTSGVIYTNSEKTGYYGNLTGIAASQGHAEILKYLIDSCKIPVDDKEYNPETKQKDGWTALQWAAAAGKNEAVEYLLGKGADINASHTSDKGTPLLYAIQSGHSLNAELLINKGADVNKANSGGTTPLMAAVDAKNIALCILLWKNKADLLVKNNEDNTALDIALDKKHYRIIDFLSSPGNYEAVLKKEYWAELNDSLDYYSNQKEYEKAISFGEKALSAAKKEFGSKHDNYGRTLKSVSIVYRQAGKLEMAARKAEDAASFYKENSGNTSIAYAAVLNQLGLIYNALKDTAKAGKNYRQALAILRMPGNKDNLLESVLYNIAGLYMDNEQYATALPLLEEMIKMQEEIYGQESSDYMDGLTMLANASKGSGKISDALASRKLKAALSKKLFGDSTVKYAAELNQIAMLYEKINDTINTENYYRQAIEILRNNRPIQKILIDVIENLADFYEKMNRFDDAIVYSRENYGYIEILEGGSSEHLASNCNRQARLYEQLSQYAMAEPLYIQALEIRKKIFGENHPDYAQSLNNLAVLYSKTGKYEKVEPLYLKAKEIWKKTLGEKSKDYLICLNNLGSLYNTFGQFNKAESYYIQSKELRKIVFGENSPEYATSLNNLAYLYDNMGNYTKAEPLFIEAISIRKKVQGSEHPDYATCLNNLGSLYNSMGKYKKAEGCFTEAMKIIRKVYGNNHFNYSNCLNNLALLNSDMGDYKKSLVLFMEALEIRKRVLGENHPDYAISLNNLASAYKNIGQYEKAEQLYLDAGEIIRKTMGENHPHYATNLSTLANLYKETGRYEKAEALHIKVNEIRKIVLGENHPDYVTGLNNLGVLYSKTGKYEKAELLYLQAKEIRKNILGETHPAYATSLNNLANLYMSMGQYGKAEQLFVQAKEIRKNVLGESHPDYAFSLNNLAVLYRETGRFSRAETLYKEANEIIKKVLGSYHADYALGLNNLAALYQAKGEYDKAEAPYLEAIDIRKKMLGENHPDYALSLNNLAYLYSSTGKYEKAERLYQSAITILKKTFGPFNTDYALSLNNLILLFMKKREYDKAEKYFIEYNLIEIKNMFSVFDNLSENEKGNYLENKMILNDENNSFLYNYKKQNPVLSQTNYDLQLLLKSLSLASTKNAMDAVRNSSDTTVQILFDKWKTNKAVLAKQYSLPVIQRMDDLKNLEEQTENQEKELTRKSAEFKNQQQSLEIKTQNVRGRLKEDEIALEFVRFELLNKEWTDSVIYAAYILTPKDSIPVFVPLFEEKQLQKLFDSAGTTANAMVSKFYRGLDLGNTGTAASLGKDLYNLVWAPLEPYLKGIKTISYSPAGKLYSIAFHALPVDSNTLLMDKYQLNQYTSTRQIALRKTEQATNAIQSITLFGDAAFTLDSTAIAKSKKDNIAITNIYTPQNRGNRGSSWADLPGTAEEVKKIKQLFEQNRISTKTFTQNTASEENLKALTGHSPQILHIATHGFFLPEPDKKTKDNISGNGNSYSLADDPLMRSGLILSGGNYAWSGKTPIEGVEDGIATAYEISQLNLSNTELVVLSACETALGDVKGSEGVFGLQRAFKMAGVKKMIVSLWQVPDKETAELMTTFYNYWLKGKTVEQAFTQAQAEMRKKYSPYYWAAFVLVE